MRIELHSEKLGLEGRIFDVYTCLFCSHAYRCEGQIHCGRSYKDGCKFELNDYLKENEVKEND